MKKILFMIPLLFLAGCLNQVQVGQTEPTQPGTKTVAEKKSTETILYYGETAVFGSYDFTVLDYYETDFLKSNNQFEGDLSSSEYSKFVVADVRYLNTKDETFNGEGQGYWKLTDSKGRKYDNISCGFYSDKCDNRNMQYKPGIPTEAQIIFEVAGDSEGYYIQDKSSKNGITYKIMFNERPDNQE